MRDGRPCLLEAHLGRLTQSARLMDLPAARSARVARAIEAAAAARGRRRAADEGVLRLVYSRGRESGSAPTADSRLIGAVAGPGRRGPHATGWRR